MLKWNTSPSTADVHPICIERAPKMPPAMCWRMRKGFAPSNLKPTKACVMSKIPASSPPQKIAASGRDDEPLTAAATEAFDGALPSSLETQAGSHGVAPRFHNTLPCCDV